MKTVSAFAPANISLLFLIVPDPDPAIMGSKGLGFTISEGVTATVTPSAQTQILWNGVPIVIPTVEFVLKQLTQSSVSVNLNSILPLGCGFGLSGASALSVAYAVNKCFELKKTQLELVKFAHIAEVINGTGLGDVVNQYFGGMCFKNQVSSKFIVEKFPFIGTQLYYKVFDKIETKAIIRNTQKQVAINTAGEVALTEVEKLMRKDVLTFSRLLNLSYEFCVKSQLDTPQTNATIAEITKNGGAASMILVGNAVVSDQPFPQAKKLTISDIAAHLLEKPPQNEMRYTINIV